MFYRQDKRWRIDQIFCFCCRKTKKCCATKTPFQAWRASLSPTPYPHVAPWGL